jgi:ATP-binding cassette subfamily B protein
MDPAHKSQAADRKRLSFPPLFSFGLSVWGWYGSFYKVVYREMTRMNSSGLPVTLPAFFCHFLKKQKFAFVILFLTMLGWPINEMLIPYLLRHVVDILGNADASKDQALMAVMPWIVFSGILWLFNEVSLRSSDWMAARVLPRFRTDITMAMFAHTQGHSQRYFGETFAGGIGNRVTKLAWSMSAIVFDCLHNFFPVTVSFFIGVILMAFIHPLFAVVIMLWFIVQMGSFLWLMQRCQRYSEDHSAAVSRLNGAIIDVFTNITTMRLFARSRYEQTYVGGYQKDEQQRSQKLMHYLFQSKVVFGLIAVITLFGWWALVLRFWYLGDISLGEVTQLLMQQWSLTALVWYMGMQLMQFYEQVGVCNDSLSLVRTPYDMKDAPDAKPLVVTRGDIRFENVNFYYQAEREVFTEKTVTLRGGEKVGLVGFSGSGKSTFVNLILRLYDVKSGRILIDGQNIAGVTRDSLHAQIAMIPQDPTLFHRSLGENIRYGRLEATDIEVTAAAAKAHADDFIAALPEKYNTLVGERGVKLSGGERQRIAIARAILKDAPILILDEATSALDSVSEQQIRHSLHSLMQGRTVIAIAHRLSTLADMDRILVFDQGQIIEEGTHAELMKKNGRYALMWQRQSGGFLPEMAE